VLIFTSLLTGLFFLVMGFFKLGWLVRYIPFPVVGGFLAGTGLLLIQASFGVMTDLPLTLPNILVLMQPDQLIRWMPGVIIAIVLLTGLKKIDHILIMPGIIIGAVLLLYLVLLVTGTSIDEAIQRGLLLGEFSKEATWQPLRIAHLFSINWKLILGQSGNIASIFTLSIMSLLLNATGLELAIERDIDIDHELRAAGVANILSGLGGGMIGYQALSESALSFRLGARGRLVGVGIGVITILILFTSASILTFFPKMILGGLLLFLGIEFLVEWVISGWKKLSRIDYSIVMLILIVIATTDFLMGVGIGLLATVLLFVVNYSRVGAIHHTLSGSERRSNVERDERQWHKLQELGDHTYILELQGYIFFGTAYALLEKIQSRINDQNRLPVRYVILDFQRVSELDSSAVFSFIKCRQSAETHNIIILLTHVSEKIKHKLALSGLLDDDSLDDKRNIRLFPDLDHGLEWCEDRLLGKAKFPEMRVPTTLDERLVDQGFPQNMIPQLMKYIERVNIEADGYLIRQGDVAEDLYFVESGRLSIYLEMGNDKKMRLQTLSRRTVVGELGLYINLQRTASIIAEGTCVAYRLTKSDLAEIKKKDPDLAAAVHEFIACLLARRLADTTQLLAALDQ
jgi:SulP family sulfate permease